MCRGTVVTPAGWRDANSSQQSGGSFTEDLTTASGWPWVRWMRGTAKALGAHSMYYIKGKAHL